MPYPDDTILSDDAVENERAVIGGNNPPTAEEILEEKCSELLSALEFVAAETTKTVNTLRPKGGAAPVINSDEDVASVAPLATKARDIFSKLEATRGEEKKPHWDAGKAVDAFFKPHKERATRIFDTLESLASDFQNRKIAAERAAARAEAEKNEKEAQRLREEAEASKRTETAERKLAQAEGAELKADEAIEDANASNAALGAVRGGDGSVIVSARTVWAATVVDYEAIPLDKLRPYLDRAAIEKALNAYVKIHKGAAQLEGVNFTEKAKASFR